MTTYGYSTHATAMCECPEHKRDAWCIVRSRCADPSAKQGLRSLRSPESVVRARGCASTEWTWTLGWCGRVTSIKQKRYYPKAAQHWGGEVLQEVGLLPRQQLAASPPACEAPFGKQLFKATKFESLASAGIQLSGAQTAHGGGCGLWWWSDCGVRCPGTQLHLRKQW
jgi:hypothetical protein